MTELKFKKQDKKSLPCLFFSQSKLQHFNSSDNASIQVLHYEKAVSHVNCKHSPPLNKIQSLRAQINQK